MSDTSDRKRHAGFEKDPAGRLQASDTTTDQGANDGSGPACRPQLPGGRIIGIDYGRQRVGMALSDPDQKIASPWTLYRRRDPAQDARYFQHLAAEQNIVGWVVGVPVHMSGEESEMSREARQFGHWLAEQTGLPVAFWDERYTTREADQHLAAGRLSPTERIRRRDMVAAQILLQSYLDRGPKAEQEPKPLDG